jgi:hypothetical protein
MSKAAGKFRISSAGGASAAPHVEKDGILIGRLETCDLVLDHLTVSRIHAAINFSDSHYFVVNLSTSAPVTLNGRLLKAQETDVLTEGDTIQIGPYAILVESVDDAISLLVQELATDRVLIQQAYSDRTPDVQSSSPSIDDVLKVFWQKRTREKEDWGSRLRPTEKPRPGKAMFNWRPTRDLRRPWRTGLFVWAFVIIGAIGVLAFYNFPNTYAPRPLTSAHASEIRNSPVAIAPNGNSCTTCHTPDEPMENSCIRCHQATGFQASNTRAHEDAGVTCVTCHQEHRGGDFDMNTAAIRSCAEGHNDNNRTTYNGKSVSTPQDGTNG